MSYHQTRPDEKGPSPSKAGATVMVSGRVASPQNDNPIEGGIQNATVEGAARSPEQEKGKVKEYHTIREETKKEQAAYFDPKSGKPKAKPEVKLGPDPQGDGNAPLEKEKDKKENKSNG